MECVDGIPSLSSAVAPAQLAALECGRLLPPPAAAPGQPGPAPLAHATATDSPAALLAASIVRSRATYFERLSSSSRGSGSSQQQDFPTSPLGQDGPPGSRHSTALAAQPLHPLAPHPLAGQGRSNGARRAAASTHHTGDRQQHHHHQRQHQRQRHQQLQPESDSEFDEDEVDTFFDKPSYTCYSAAVELSPASSYGGGVGSSVRQPPTDSAMSSCGGAEPEGPSAAAPSQAVSSSSGEGPSVDAALAACGRPSAVPEVPAACSSGYVRSMSAHFARVSTGSPRGNAGMDGLFDDLVVHVGALLASHPDVEAQMGMVQGLSDRLLELHALCEKLGRKEDEVEHLRGVLRELTMTRAEAIRLKVQMAESLNGLQQEYYKVLRSAQLAQGTCKQHSARAAATRKQLVDAQSELMRYKRAVASLRDRNRRLRSENEDMAARLHALEQGKPGAEGHRSACYMALVQAQTPVLY